MATTYSDPAATFCAVPGFVTQWAAVRIRLPAITEPPQKWPLLELCRSDTMKGHEPSGAAVPLMIRACATALSTIGLSMSAAWAAGAMAATAATRIGAVRKHRSAERCRCAMPRRYGPAGGWHIGPPPYPTKITRVVVVHSDVCG